MYAPARTLFIACVLFFHGLGWPLLAAEFLENFDGPKTTWQLDFDKNQCRLVEHDRHAKIRHEGTGSEHLILDVTQATEIDLTHSLSPALILDELIAGVWVRSNRAGVTFSLRVVYPHVRDAETGEFVTRLMEGESYSADGTWQRLTCKTSDKEMAHRTRLLRAQLGTQIDVRDAYVDRAFLRLEAAPGTTEVFIDELQLGPVVSPRESAKVVVKERLDASQFPKVEMRLDRLSVDGKPSFPRMFPYHGEPVVELQLLGCNPIWIPDTGKTELLKELQARGLWAMATPPVVRGFDGQILNEEEASITPFGPETDEIAFWMLGAGIAPQDKPRLASWRSQLLSADRRRQRPLVADITGNERSFSRLIPLLGISRESPQTSLTLVEYRQWLSDRQQLTRPGSFVWTSLAMESPEEIRSLRDALGLAPGQLEPEQLWLQAWCALAAGCRGLGFWTNAPLLANDPETREMWLALQQLNLQLELLEPWLATGSVVGRTRAILSREAPPPISDSKIATKTKDGTKPEGKFGFGESRFDQVREDPNAPPLEVTLIESDHGLLVLVTWLDPTAQYVPGGLAAHDVQILVPGVKETSKAWEISTTDVHPLKTAHSDVAGGTLIEIPRFEMATAVIISSDLTLRETLREQMLKLQPRSAECLTQLARAKWERVRQVDKELRNLRAGYPEADRFLRRAQLSVMEAEAAFKKGQFQAAREAADVALQALRILQRAHWSNATRRLTHPAATLHTVSFQSLPDYWQMTRQFQMFPKGESIPVENLFHGGNFEDPEVMRTTGWQHLQHEVPGIVASAGIARSPESPGHALWLAAGPAAETAPPLVVPQPPLHVVSPEILVERGSLLRITGRVRVTKTIQGSADGFELRESLGRAAGALRWHRAGDWQRFELFREVVRSGPLTLEFVLHGLGEVYVDDLRVEYITPKESIQPAAAEKSNPSSKAPRSRWSLPPLGLRERLRTPALQIPSTKVPSGVQGP